MTQASAPSLASESRSAPPARWVVALSSIGLIAIFGYLLIYHLRHERFHDNAVHLGDFPTFYQAAQFARAHGDIFLASAGPGQPYVYPPLVAFAYVPLTFLTKPHAAALMLLATAAMLAGSLLLGAKAMLSRLGCARPGMVLVVAFCVALLNENEMRGEMTMLETNALILLLFILALRWLDRRPTLAGIALAVVMNVKYLSVVTLPYLLIRRRWRAAGSMVVGTVGFALLPATLLGWRENLRGIRIALGGIGKWIGMPPPTLSNGSSIFVQEVAAKLSLSVTSSIARLCGPTPGQTRLALALTALVVLATLGIVWAIYRKHGLPLWAWPSADRQRTAPFRALVAVEWAGLIAGSLAFSPDTNPRHLVLAVIVNLLAVSVLLAPRRLAWRWPAITGIMLIFLGLAMLVRSWGPVFYYPLSIPGWSLLIGYLLILKSAADVIRESTQNDSPASA
jgi:Glycosyltransferase family 87